MQNQLEDIKNELINRIFKLFIKQFDGNKLQFAKACKCDEKAIRKLFNNEQGLTLNLFLKIANALKISPSELLKDLELKD
jgi:hypothetical protein